MEKILSKIKAEGIQNTILNDIRDQIPARLVNPLWETFSIEIGGISRPCDCEPKRWLQMVEALRQLVNTSLTYWEEQEKVVVVIEEPPVVVEVIKKDRKSSK